MSNFDDRCDENDFSYDEIKRLKKLLKNKALTKKQRNEIEFEIEAHEIGIEQNEDL